MNYSTLLKNKTREEIVQIIDNWRSRLNKLKDKYAIPVDVGMGEYRMAHYNNDKAHRIAISLITRISSLAQVYRYMSEPQPNYQSGAL